MHVWVGVWVGVWRTDMQKEDESSKEIWLENVSTIESMNEAKADRRAGSNTVEYCPQYIPLLPSWATTSPSHSAPPPHSTPLHSTPLQPTPITPPPTPLHSKPPQRHLLHSTIAITTAIRPPLVYLAEPRSIDQWPHRGPLDKQERRQFKRPRG